VLLGKELLGQPPVLGGDGEPPPMALAVEGAGSISVDGRRTA
jgi:hypothetical protein